MKVTFANGKTARLDPIANCTGYRAEKIEMTGRDFRRLAWQVQHDPNQAVAVLMQLSGRILEDL